MADADEAPADIAALLSALRGPESGAASAAAAEVAALAGRPVLRDALITAGVVPALAVMLATSSARSVSARAAARAMAVLAAASPEAAQQAVTGGALAPLVALAGGPPGEASAAAAAAALWHCAAGSQQRRDAIWAAGAGPRLCALLSGGAACEASVAAAAALGELAAESGSLRESLRDMGGVKALTTALNGAGLDTPLGAQAVAALLRLSHSESLRLCLADAGRSCWKLVNGLSAVEDPSNERARPGARLQALLLMGMLFCVGKDGNRAAGKMLNRFDIARHVAAVLSASFKAPDGRYLGVKWSPFEAVLYVRVLAENEDFTDRLSEAGAHGLLAELLASGAMGASPLLHAAVAGLHMASRDIASVTQREVKAAEDALTACREMLEIPVQHAMLAMCCSAPRPMLSSSVEDGPPPQLVPRSPKSPAAAQPASPVGAVPAGLAPARTSSRGTAVGAVPAWAAGDGSPSPSPRAA